MRLLVPPPVQALACAGLMYFIAIYLPQFGFSLPFGTVLATVLVILGVSIDLASISLFYKAKTTVSPISPDKASALVQGGIYRYTRNPMYLGLAIILTGFAVWLSNAASFLMVPCFILYVTRFQIVPEEQVLREKFGSEYEEYCEKVGRWI